MPSDLTQRPDDGQTRRPVSGDRHDYNYGAIQINLSMHCTIRIKLASIILGLAVCIVNYVEAADGLAVFQHDLPIDEALVSELIEQLHSPTRAERTAAEQQLREMGPGILPLLPAADEIESAHAREVVEELRRELELVAAEQAIDATMVHVPAVATVGEWLAALEEQTGYSFEPADETIAALAVSRAETATTDEPTMFWQAVSDLESRAPIEVGRSPTGGLVIDHRDSDGPIHSYSVWGAIRITASELREIDNLIDPEQCVRLRAQLRIDVEPKLAGLFMHWNPSDLHASVGDIELTPTGAGGRRELPIPASQRIEFPVDFTAPREAWEQADPAAGEFNIGGTILVKVATGFREFSFRHLDEPGAIVRGQAGVVVTLESFESARTQAGEVAWEALLAVDYQSQPLELDSYQLWVFSNAVSLQRDDGSVLVPSGERHVSPAEGGSVRMSFRFDDPLEDLATATLIYEAPTAIMDVLVEFEIEELRQ